MSRPGRTVLRVSLVLALLGATSALPARADGPTLRAEREAPPVPTLASRLDASWVLEDAIDTHGFHIEHYGQRLEGLRVDGASAVVRARRDGTVDLVRVVSPVRSGAVVSGFSRRTPSVERVAQSISAADVGFSIVSLGAPEPVLAALDTEPSARLSLAHRVLVRGASRAEIASVLLEDTSLRVLRVDLLAHDARGLVYLRNSVSDDGMTTEVELPHQSDPASLTNEAFTVRSCMVGAGGACTPVARALPDGDGNFLIAPDPASFEDGFAEVMAFHHANLLADRLEADHAFRWHCPLGDDSMRIFPNFTDAPGRGYANAAFVPSTRDECGYLIFGQTGMQDFASDADVVYHELGHAVTDQLAHIVGFGVDSLGLHYDPLAVNEGTSDYWAATTQGDPHVGESLQGIDGLGRSAALRDLDGALSCPGDLFGEGHFDGRIWAGTFWDLRTELGAEKVDALVFATVASLTTNPSLRDAGEIAASTADGLATMGTLTTDDAARVRALLSERGLLDCRRITPLDDGEQRGAFSGLAILTGGLGNDVAPVHYSLEIPADVRSATLEITAGTLTGQYAILARHDQPVGFRGPSIQRDQRDEIGHGGAVTYHLSDPALVPCTTLYFAIESMDLERGENIFLVQASLERTGDPSARCPDPVPDAGPPDAFVPSDAFETPDASMGAATGGGCGCAVTSTPARAREGLAGLGALGLAALAISRRRRTRR